MYVWEVKEMKITPSGLAHGTTVAHRLAPTTHWTVVKDVVGGVLLSGTDAQGKAVQVVAPSYFLVTV